MQQHVYAARPMRLYFSAHGGAPAPHDFPVGVSSLAADLWGAILARPANARLVEARELTELTADEAVRLASGQGAAPSPQRYVPDGPLTVRLPDSLPGPVKDGLERLAEAQGDTKPGFAAEPAPEVRRRGKRE